MSSLTLDPEPTESVVATDDQIVAEGDWWSNCSTAELKDVVAVGIGAGTRFDEAVREIERRSRARRDETETRTAEIKRRGAIQDRTIRLVIVAGLVVLVVLVVLVLASRA